MRRNRDLSALFILLAVFCASTLFGQDVSTAALKGTITDQSGAVVVGATVKVTNSERGIERVLATDANGLFQAPFLPPGTYDVRITAKGFETHILKNIVLTVGQIAVVDTPLQVGAVGVEVFITAEAPLVETEKTQQANTIQSRQIESLPNIGRSFLNYVYTLPGVSSSNAPRAQGNGNFNFGSTGFSIGGSNGRANLITVDGGENEFGDGEPRFFVSPESVQEFQVNRNGFAAEFGFTSGTAMNVISKSGTNTVHGALYTYFRDQKTSARNYFDRNKTKAFDQQLYPGMTLGGPILRNKLFFFTSYEFPRLTTARFRAFTNNTALLNPDAGQTAFLARADSSADANVRRISGLLRGQLTTTNFPDTMKLLTRDEGTFADGSRDHQLTNKMDYQISSNDTLSGRFSFFKHTETGNECASSPVCTSNRTLLRSHDYTALVNWTRNVRPNLINQARFQFSPDTAAQTASVNPTGSELSIGGVGTFGRSFTAPFNTFEKRFQFEDTMSWIKNGHFVKFGGSYRPVRYNVVNALWFSGTWAFSPGVYSALSGLSAADQASVVAFNGGAAGIPTLNGLQSFNLGLPLTYRQGFNNPEWTDWAKFLGLFIQDSWKVSKRFTLDYGVRFDSDSEPKPLKTYNNVSPRLGFAWDPFGDGKTVIRGGGGLFQAPVGYQIDYLTNLLNDSGKYINQIFKITTAAIPIWAAGIKSGKLPFTGLSEAEVNAVGVATGPKSNGRVVFDAASQYKNTYSAQFNFGIARQLARDFSLDVAYNHYRGVHIQLDQEINFKKTGVFIPGIGPGFTAIDPTIAQFNNYSSIGNSNYNGMTVSLSKRYSLNTTFQAHYTFSHSLDDVTDYNSAFAATDPTNLQLEKATSAFNVKHNFVANGVFNSPWKTGPDGNVLGHILGDITVSPIVSLRSGIPFSLLLGGDRNGDNHGGDRPIYASRNTGLGANFYSWDMRLNKQFYFNRERGIRAEFLVEGVNILNHTNFQAVNNLSAGNNPKYLVGPFPAGVFNVRGDKNLPQSAPLGFVSSFDPRRLQFGLKIAF